LKRVWHGIRYVPYRTAKANRIADGVKKLKLVGRDIDMKTIGTAATLIGAVSLMLAIIVAQRDYQRSWTAGVVQANAQSEIAPAAPERLAQANQ
jgi:hypothetical protein